MATVLEAMEWAAAELLSELGNPQPPISAVALARRCRVAAPAAGRDHARQWLVALELGHLALKRYGHQAAVNVAEALLLPRKAFSADLLATRWDLRQLAAKHVHCSPELLARRIVSLRDACVAVWERGRVVERHVSPWLPEGLQEVSAWEREIAAHVHVARETVEAGPFAWGFVRGSGVITLCAA